jgi:hypothetical protein
MLTMDDYDVIINDSVFDMERGYGVVVEVRADGFVVKFSSRLVFFAPNGVAARRKSRTLYWHDPRVVIPAKDADKWDNQRRAMRAFTDFVATIDCRSAQVVPDE